MGAVYLAQDQNLDLEVAVKVNRDPSEQASRQFIKEAQLLASLHHHESSAGDRLFCDRNGRDPGHGLHPG